MEQDVKVVKKKILILMIDYYSWLTLMNIMEYISIAKRLDKYLENQFVVVVELVAYYAQLNLQMNIDHDKINILYKTQNIKKLINIT